MYIVLKKNPGGAKDEGQGTPGVFQINPRVLQDEGQRTPGVFQIYQYSILHSHADAARLDAACCCLERYPDIECALQ